MASPRSFSFSVSVLSPISDNSVSSLELSSVTPSVVSALFCFARKTPFPYHVLIMLCIIFIKVKFTSPLCEVFLIVDPLVLHRHLPWFQSLENYEVFYYFIPEFLTPLLGCLYPFFIINHSLALRFPGHAIILFAFKLFKH